MLKKETINVALIGNPNTGKTSLFNQLTGLNQKVGNYPGVTVDKKQGKCKLPGNKTATITDLPGTYSINPTSLDESVVLDVLLSNDAKIRPDVILVVVEIENIKRNLLLFSQIKDLGIPTILVVNMADQMTKRGITIDTHLLAKKLDTDVVLISARNKIDIIKVKDAIVSYQKSNKTISNFEISKKIDQPYFDELNKISDTFSLYELWLMITQNNCASSITSEEKEKLNSFKNNLNKIKKYQHKETIYRYQHINSILKETYVVDITKAKDLRSRLDAVFTHKIFGYLIFLGILLLMFQSIFEWSSLPMDFIDALFSDLSEYTKAQLPSGLFTDLITDGIIPGLGGVLIFIPQIVVLFLLIALLEETGYMSRVVFLMDKIMRKFGMSGKSVIPLISGTACAIPAVMATRTITSWKERLITILVTPFTTCAARLPVYAILIAIIIPKQKVFGFLGLQGITLLGFYILGFATAIIAAFILHKTLNIKNNSFFVVEMPNYKMPSIKNVFLEVVEKTKAFVVDAGKIILAISILLWFLATHGPTKFNTIESEITTTLANQNLTEEALAQKVASAKLEYSYIGIAGKSIEPIVKPLGYDWKIGIGLITSFAAREVFVGTLATIYSVENITIEEQNTEKEFFKNTKAFFFDDGNDEEQDDDNTIKERMKAEINIETGGKRFNFATGMSLLVFYAFAMQCMATLAIVKRETKSWRWPMIQLFGMGILAYISALLVYQFLK